ncbi:MAG: acetyl-CoA carboxylase, biotin carboxyl carrier protein, partial [Bryobacterales bacterium]|nr:acetyl-CoA carboxylase, biotin carboxyl carrier protein [Bryobacterales bacterium]
YYASPEPGAPPFVKVGDVVDLETTVGLIEIMKVFTAVAAGVCGVVTEMCVQDTEFVEYAQILYRVRPS